MHVPSPCAPDAPLYLEFSHPVKAEDLAAHVSVGREFRVSPKGDGFELRAKNPFALGEKGKWIIGAGLRSGRFALEEPAVCSFEVCAPLTLHEARGTTHPGGGTISFRTNNPLSDRKPRVQVRPPAECRWQYGRLAGAFLPRQTYSITLEDLEDRFGNRLTTTVAVTMPDFEPQMEVATPSGTLELRADPHFAARFVNRQSMRFRTRTGHDLAHWLRDDLGDAPWIDRILSETPNNVSLFRHPLPPGLTFVEIEAGDQRERVRIQVTDLAIHAKRGGDLLLWTASLSAGAPVSADVTVHDGKGRELWSGRTGPDGIARAPVGDWVVARLGDDVAILDLDGDSIPIWRHNVATGRAPTVHLVTDRGIYRPGDVVRLKGTLRPATNPVEVTIRDPRDRVVLSERIVPSDYGTIALEYRHRERDPQGTYSVLVGRECAGSFRVESYRPAPFEVRIRDGRFVEAAYFFGAPVTGKIWWTATIEETSFRPPGHDGFDFGDATRERAEVERRTGTTSEISIPLKRSRHPRELAIEAKVTDASHQSAWGSYTRTLHPAELYLGVRADSRVLSAGRPSSVRVIAVDPHGAERPAVARFTILRREWHTVAKRSAGGSTTYHSEPVDERIFETALLAPVTVSFTPPRAGTYLLRAESGDSLTVAEVWVTGPEIAGWRMRDDHRLRLVADRTSYRPGDVARVLVPSPFAEARALVTVERERVLDHRVLTVGTSSALEIPIEPGHAPNVFVSVLVIHGRSYRLGYLTLPVHDPARRLDVRVAPARSEYEPREEVALDLDAHGEVTVMVVDEAVLALTGYATPDPHAFFSRPRPLAVRSSDSRRTLLAPVDEFGRKGEPGGGGGGKEPHGRSHFLPTVHYQTLECRGRARVTFTLPDNVTRYRVMAFAVSKGDAYGSAQSSFVVRKPLLLTSALPRFARAGDRFEARVLVHGEGEATLEFRGTTRTQRIPSAFSFPVETPKAGIEKFLFRTSGDALEVELPVLPAAPTETRVLYGRGSATVRVPLDEMDVTISRSPLAELEEGLRYLLEYPHGCIEQTTSRTLPLLAVRWGEDGPALALVRGDVRPYAQAGIHRILSMQTDGGFGYWPSSREPHAWGTVYATHALVLASRQGYDVPAAALTRALEDVAKLLRTEAPVTVRAYATWVLSLAGRPDPGYVDALSRRPDLTRAARCFLQLAGGAPGPARARDDDDVYSGLEPALELLVRPTMELAEEILRERQEGRWPTTTRNAFAILALAALAEPPKRTVHVHTPFGERLLGAPLRHSGPARDFSITAEAPVYWTVRARGVSAEKRRLDRGIGLLREAPAEARAGELVVIRLRVVVREAMRYVAIEVPLPAGLEPIPGDAECRDDRAVIYADDLRPGVQVFSCRLRATTPGTFAFPAARAERMYRPEVFGTTAGTTLIVR